MVRYLIIATFLMILTSSCKKITNSYQPQISNSVSVLTQHNDNTRAGLNDKETILNTTNVNTNYFGKLFTLPVDDEVYAQPLVVGNLVVGGRIRNIVYIATVNNSLYAYDALNGELFWEKNFTGTGNRPPNALDVDCTNFTQNMGIVGTPVIDLTSGTIYFVSRSTEGIHFHQYLHAVGLTDGSDKLGSPVEIKASVPGTGDGNVNDTVYFDPLRNNQRQGLALVNGIVYISWASHCDWNPYHGWVIGYDASTLNQKFVYCDTPGGAEGGIWESGMGIAADSDGNLYITTGNGTVGQSDPTDLSNRGESALKLIPSGSGMTISSYFTPSNYQYLNDNDLDYGVMGTFLIPNSHYYFTGGKDGNIYILERDDMGGYSATLNNVQQTIKINDGLHCQPAWYSGNNGEFAFIWSENDALRAIPYNRNSNTFSGNQILSDVSGPGGESGAEISVSSNGRTDGTGIVWAAYAISTDADIIAGPGILRAFDANDITKQLWNSSQSPADNPGYFAKFSAPTIANGYVYLATFSKQVVVYGLK
ncbi:MAG: hypothetical protein Q8868_07115 [Bacteroidota bacterium]|nr:hypothetical protein [Bacteroidota bacterium]